ncbi:hypothetical protein J6590_052342 [Homalodisca vitripennis]|nr:hypothetical protein J6590_052342 [Homalodisca vitripennis]
MWAPVPWAEIAQLPRHGQCQRWTISFIYIPLFGFARDLPRGELSSLRLDNYPRPIVVPKCRDGEKLQATLPIHEGFHAIDGRPLDRRPYIPYLFYCRNNCGNTERGRPDLRGRLCALQGRYLALDPAYLACLSVAPLVLETLESKPTEISYRRPDHIPRSL